MKQLFLELIEAVELFSNKRITGEELEERTSALIIRDDYEELPEEIQLIVELLDTWEIQELTEKDLQIFKEKLKDFTLKMSRG